MMYNRSFLIKRSIVTLLFLVTGWQLVSHGAGSSLTKTAWPVPQMRTFEIGSEAFDPKGGHIQGATASEEALYLTQATSICKVDWSGKLIKKISAINHTGDICWHNKQLYTGIVIRGGPNRGKGMIQVFDEELNLQRETLIELDQGIDGITCLNGTLYIAIGTTKVPHRINLFARFDPVTLKEIAPRQEVDYGHETYYGAQNLLTNGELLFARFYGVKGSPSFVQFDKDLNVLQTFRFGTGEGADFIPAAHAGGKVRVFTVRTTGRRATSDQPAVPPGARIQFFDFNGKQFTAIP